MSHTVPVHVIAREIALGTAFDTLGSCAGRVPAIGNYGLDYNDAVLAECTRELFGMLDRASVPKGENWLPVRHGEGSVLAVHCATDEERRERDASVVLFVSGADVRVGLLMHQKDTDELQVRLPGTRRRGIELGDVLGARHAVVERVEHTSRHASSERSVILVGYVGDLIASMTASCTPAARDDERAAPEEHVGFDDKLLQTLRTGVRRNVQWPLVHRERVTHLNDTQYRALDTLTHNVELIRGPPGTDTAHVLAFTCQSHIHNFSTHRHGQVDAHRRLCPRVHRRRGRRLRDRGPEPRGGGARTITPALNTRPGHASTEFH